MKSKIVIIGITTIIAVMAFVGFLKLSSHDSSNAGDSADNDPITGEPINYGPPSQEEINAGEQSTQNQNGYTAPLDSQGNNVVTPLISTWVQNFQTKNLELNAFVPTITENGGKCRLTLTKGGLSVTKDKAAQADAQTTTCGIIEVEKSKIENGVWTATVEYSSTTSYGKSSPVEVEIK